MTLTVVPWVELGAAIFLMPMVILWAAGKVVDLARGRF